MSDHAWCTVAMAKTKGGTWEVVAQLAGWGSADLWQEAAETPPHAEGADAESPAGFLCDRSKENAITRAGYHSDIFLFYDHNLFIFLKKDTNKQDYFHIQQIQRKMSLCPPDPVEVW